MAGQEPYFPWCGASIAPYLTKGAGSALLMSSGILVTEVTPRSWAASQYLLWKNPFPQAVYETAVTPGRLPRTGPGSPLHTPLGF